MKYKVLAYCIRTKEWVTIKEYDNQDEAVARADLYHQATGADTMVEVNDGGKH